jgi:thiamine pyrophosphate-dependent acetolactate synthase large subunit-like protein
VNVAEVVGHTLARLGVAHAFGVVGSGNFEVTNALRANGVPYTAARHEAGAATMADAYARMSDRVTVVTVHQGCGLTNALTGITEAAKSRTPLLVLAAESAGNFRVDQDALALAVEARATRVTSVETAVAETVEAFRTAVRERRTVVLNLPLDVQRLPAEPAPVSLPQVETVPPEGAERLASLIEGAERPVFIAGRGARHARRELLELAERAGALVATSAVAHGVFQGEPWSLGISGGFSTPVAAELISGADLVVAWGCSLTKWTTRQGKLLTGTVARVDVDPDVRPTVLGDVAEVASRTQVPARTGYRTADVKSRLDSAQWTYEDLSDGTRIDPRELSRKLDEILPTERVVAVDSGNFMGYPSAYLRVPDQYGFCLTQAFQSIGLGLATAIGAALAQPHRLPVAAVGDGGFLMSIAELETVVRLNLPMLIVVYNDSAYGAEVHHFGDADMTTVTFPDTDIAAIARGYGLHARTVRALDDLGGLTFDRPTLLDAKIASDGGSWWLQEAFS